MERTMVYDVFLLITKQMSINEILSLRLVCKEWKYYVEEYFRKQEVLSIYRETNLHQISSLKLTMDLNFNDIIRNRLKIDEKNLSSTEFTSIIVKLFPNIKEFYMLPNFQFVTYRSNWDMETLLSSWNNLKKLVISYVPNKCLNFVECFNKLESLETLVILKDIQHYGSFLNGTEPFIKRISRLYLPTLDWFNKPETLPNITSLALTEDDVNFYCPSFISQKRFPNLRNLNLVSGFFSIHPNYDDQSYSSVSYYLDYFYDYNPDLTLIEFRNILLPLTDENVSFFFNFRIKFFLINFQFSLATSIFQVF